MQVLLFFRGTCRQIFTKKDIRLRQHVSYLSSLPEETIDWCPSTPHMYTPSQLSASLSHTRSISLPFPSQPLFLSRLFIAFSFAPSPSQPSFPLHFASGNKGAFALDTHVHGIEKSSIGLRLSIRVLYFSSYP